jgi:hypothetical protein
MGHQADLSKASSSEVISGTAALLLKSIRLGVIGKIVLCSFLLLPAGSCDQSLAAEGAVEKGATFYFTL